MKPQVTVFTGCASHPNTQFDTPKKFHLNPITAWNFFKSRNEKRLSKSISDFDAVLVELEALCIENGFEFMLITESSDGNHTRAGSHNLIELFGNETTLKCSCCDYENSEVSLWESDEPECCPLCGSFLRPGIAFRGEALCAKNLLRAESAVNNSRFILINNIQAQHSILSDLIFRATGKGCSVFTIRSTGPSVTSPATTAHQLFKLLKF